MPKMKLDTTKLKGLRAALRDLSGAQLDGCLKAALYEGAACVADAVRENIEALPEDGFRYLRNGDSFAVLTAETKADLADSLGVSAHRQEEGGDAWSVSVGFQGYGSRQHPTKQYPNGIPNQMIARAIESGSSVRQKHPFVRPAMDRAKAEAERRIQEKFDQMAKQFIKE